VIVTGTELAAVTDRLVAAGCIAAGDEAAELVAAAPDGATLERWVQRREAGEPPGWITGTFRFCDQTLHLAPGVYVPRRQSEELAIRAASLLPEHGRAIDLCTGAGPLAAHLARQVPTATVFGIDVDPVAASCARRNGVLAAAADLDAPLHAGGSFDVVTAVAPYVPTDDLRLLPADVQRYEPRRALDGGADGLTLVRAVIAAAARLLCRGSWLLIEVGGTQDRGLASAFETHAFDVVEPWTDDDGDLRGIAARTAIGP
jgi:release factor glutamine methyltransferase